MILGFTIGGAILTLPNRVAAVFGASGWFLVLIVGILFVTGGWLTARLSQGYPDETVIEFSQRLLGKPLGIIIGVGFTLFFFAIIPIEVRILQEVVNISILDGAPSWFVSGSFLLVMAYAASRNIDELAQVNELLIEIALVVGLGVTILAWQHFNPLHVMAFLEKEQIDLNKYREVLGTVYVYAGYPVVAMLLPFVREPKRVAGATILGTILITLIYTFFTFTVIGVFGYKETLSLAWPGLELAKSVNIEAAILERLDLIMIISWISAIFTTTALAFFFTALGVSKLLGLRRHSLIVWVLFPVIYFLSTSLTNYFVWNNWSFYVALLALMISFVFPVLLATVAILRGLIEKKLKRDEES